jgi:RND family efflux transporter MFP subunit
MLKKLAFFALALSVFSALSCAGKKETGPAAVSMDQLYAENGQPVSVRRLVPEDFSVYLKYPTVIQAASESTAYAGLSDVVRRIAVKVGDTVKQDDVIVSFSADNQTLKQAALTYEKALADFNRSNTLFKNSDISRQAFESVRTQYEIARANHKAANDLIYVKAPISGVITQINVRPTENVRPGAPLFTVSNQNGFETRFYVGADEIDRIQTGARAFINDPAQNLEGRITQISLAMDSQKQAFPVTAFFESASNKLVSGMGVDLSVETYRNEKAIILSRRELVQTGAGYTAFIAEGDTSKAVAVRIGHEQGLRCEIANGLREGDMLVSEGVQRLSPDSKINVVTEPALLSVAGKR